MIFSPSSRKSQQPLAKASHAFSHHALLCVGSHEECIERIPLSEQSGVDAEVIQKEQLDIAEARALCERASSRPIAVEKRTFVISCQQLSIETQNALLKLFEDPPTTAQFYIIVPRLSVLLPTLRSRLHLFYETNVSKDASDEQSAIFLNSSFSDRLAQITKLSKNKDTVAMRALIQGIERSAAKRPQKQSTQSIADFLPDILLASTYSEIRGASHKMLLEHLVLSIPANRE